jgi:hypothetical protein
MGCHCQRLASGERCGSRTVPAAGEGEAETPFKPFELFGLFMRGETVGREEKGDREQVSGGGG